MGICVAALFVRTFHTLLVLGVPASLLIKDSMLHRWIIARENLALGIIYFSLLLCSLVMYYVTCFTDPGYINLTQPKRKKRKTGKSKITYDEVDKEPGDNMELKPRGNNNKDEDDEEEGEECEDEDEETSRMVAAMHKTGVKYRVCDFCEITQPMRAKHCEDCNRCVRKFDHHCPWLEACVGERNHRFFWLFLFFTNFLILFTVVIVWSAFQWRLTWVDWLKSNGIFLVDLLILGLGGMAVLGLLGFHSYLMFQGMTTWEAASRERITYLKYLDEDYNPFNEGVCHNMAQFLCACQIRRWEKLYAEKARTGNGLV